ncbi:MAG: DUF1127 domain-containing protein [Roseococcus sp.]|nr:DUF1127 domain-containing protein [Roseococcus sp.]
MNSRITPAEAALLMPLATARRPSEAQQIEAIIAEARRARDAALAERIAAFFRGLCDILATLRRRRETIEELRALSDRQLKDIGVAPGEIEAAAAKATPLPVAGSAPEAANDTDGTRRAA